METTNNKELTTDEKIVEMGQAVTKNGDKKNIYILSVIGEIEGHDTSPESIKTTKYEHIIPKIAEIEENKDVAGVLVLLQTSGGDCSAGLAIAEMFASISKPIVSLVCGDCHSIGVPLAVSTDYSFIVPSGTMIVHPVRMSGTIIGAPQTFEYFKLIQDRIVDFVSGHSRINPQQLEKLMLSKSILTKDLGTILVGKEAVEAGIINEIGGIKDAFAKIRSLIDKQ